ncbi:hypothetical protein JCM10213_007278 [Rhodosporidiobolus nylandii]
MPSSSSFPDYYDILGVPPEATFDQIKTAYKRRSLQTHPDRIPATPGNEARRTAATVEFQAVADAHYTLSDPARRRAYDDLRTANQSRWTSEPEDSGNFWSYFAGGKDAQADEDMESERPEADHVFGSVFEEMLRPEVQRVLPLWTWTGAAAGAALGFIVGNFPGAAVGAFSGSRLGAVRDAKGKSVIQVFNTLGGDQKAEILKGLAAKVFSMAAR